MTTQAELDVLKRDVFFKLMELVGRVYIQVRYSGNALVGRRGFLDEEKDKGLVLVLNSKMKFQWDDEGLSATLLFGAKAEKCFIPIGDIVAVYSPELGVQFVTTTASDAVKEDEEPKKVQPRKREPGPPGDTKSGGEESNIIEVDFSRKSK